jgi:excisionase family DNA binding protein
MTVAEAAEILEVSTRTVYALCRAGKIRHERPGLGRGAIRILPEDLAAYRASCRVEVRDEGDDARTPRPAARKAPSGRSWQAEMERMLRTGRGA